MSITWFLDSPTPPVPETLETWLNRGYEYVAISVFILWPLLFLASFLRRWRRPLLLFTLPWLARLIAAAALFATWGFSRWILDNGALTDDLVRNFGYFSSVRPWFIVPYLVWASIPVVLYLTYRAWRRGWWSLLARAHYTLVVLALAWWLERLVRWEFIGL